MTIAALIINVFPLFKVTNFCQVDFAIGCWIYSILCECGIIASNFVFNIRFMQRISPLNLLDSLLNLIYQVFKFSTQLWKSLLVHENGNTFLQTLILILFLFCLYFVFAGWCQFVAADCDRHCVLEVGEGATSCRQWRNLTSNQSPLQHPQEYILYHLSNTPQNIYKIYLLSTLQHPPHPKPWPNHFSPHSWGLNSI